MKIIGKISIAVFSIISFICIACLSGCAGSDNSVESATQSSDKSHYAQAVANLDLEYTDRDLEQGYDENAAIILQCNGTNAEIQTESADQSISVADKLISISKEGTYVFSGSFSGQICVKTGDDSNAKVQLVLNGLSIENDKGPAILVEQADKVFITTADDTENYVKDGASYTDTSEDAANAAIYSHDDLVLNGKGILTVVGSYQHAIFTKDDLKVTGGTYNVESVEDALRGKDSVRICDGTFNIESGQDAIKASDSNEDDKGYVIIDGGVFNINAKDDAFHSETVFAINDGKVNISSCYEGYEGEKVFINGGETNMVASDDGLNAAPRGNTDAQLGDLNDGGTGANTVPQKPDDIDNTNMPQMPENGEAPQMPDGAQAPQMPEDGTQTPPDMPDMSQGQEDMDGQQTPPDMTDNTDFANVPEQPAETDSKMEMPGAGAANAAALGASEDCIIEINGGTTYICASGDGLDSNGDFNVTDGVLIVNGPTNDNDGAIDYEYDATIYGGYVFAIGASQMAAGFTSGDQAFVSGKANIEKNTTIGIVDSTGNILIAMKATNNYTHAVASTPSMCDGGSYSLVVLDDEILAGKNWCVDCGSNSVSSELTTFTASTTGTANPMGGATGANDMHMGGGAKVLDGANAVDPGQQEETQEPPDAQQQRGNSAASNNGTQA